MILCNKRNKNNNYKVVSHSKSEDDEEETLFEDQIEEEVELTQKW